MAPIGNLKRGFSSASNYAEVDTKLDMVNQSHIPKPSLSPFLGEGTQGVRERGSRKQGTNSVVEFIQKLSYCIISEGSVCWFFCYE